MFKGQSHGGCPYSETARSPAPAAILLTRAPDAAGRPPIYKPAWFLYNNTFYPLELDLRVFQMGIIWSIIVVPLAWLLTALMASISVALSLLPGGRRWHFACARLWSRMLLGIAGIRVRVHGLEHIDPGRSYVFAANHQSYSDIWSLFTVLPLEFCFVAKESLFRWPFIGWHLRRSGTISIDRRGMKDTYRALLIAAEKIRNGTSVVIFPEGTRSVTGDIGPFKRGSLLVAAKAGVPIIPVAISGSRGRLPKGSCLMRAGVIDVVIGEPIPVVPDGPSDARDVADKVRRSILKNYVKR